MAMTVNASDIEGTKLLASITSKSTAVTNAVTGSVQALNAAKELANEQRKAVQYFLANGRLQPVSYTHLRQARWVRPRPRP